MNIEKIKNYNQNMLAILVTVVSVMAFVGLFAVLFFTVMEINRFYYMDNDDTGILTEEKIETLQKENKRQQLISYESPRLVDSLKMIYLIPVSHKMLNDPELIEDATSMVMDYASRSRSDKRYSGHVYGSFNNLIVYDQEAQSSKKLFDKRINFNELHIEYCADDIIILFRASEADTYKDGVINQNDLSVLYLYSLTQQELKRISLADAGVFHFKFAKRSKDLLILFGMDRNQNGMYDEYLEPSILKRYSYDSDSLSNLVEPSMHDALQKMLDGSQD